jgi:hypothetical protein
MSYLTIISSDVSDLLHSDLNTDPSHVCAEPYNRLNPSSAAEQNGLPSNYFPLRVEVSQLNCLFEGTRQILATLELLFELWSIVPPLLGRT